MTSRLRYTLLCSLLLSGLCAGTSPSAHAQGTDGDPPTAALKVWYPRLSGLPFTKTEVETLLIGGVEYQNRTLKVAFFAETSKDASEAALRRYPTESITKLGDGWTYEYTLQETGDLLSAADYFNDLPVVRAARLLRIDNSDGTVDPTPIGGPATSLDGNAGVEGLHPGDANGDGQYNVIDAVDTLRVIVGLQTFSPFAAARADINRDGLPDVEDVVDILGLALGMGMPAPYGYR